MESKLANKPKFLQYKDLKKDSGKGFYHWMRPYERFVAEPTRPCNVLSDGLPRAFILRFVPFSLIVSARSLLHIGTE